MKIHRFIGDFDVTAEAFSIDDAELAGQMRKVLKLAPGEKVILGDGKGEETICEILNYTKEGVELGLCDFQGENENESIYESVLCLSILKKDNFELAAQKATEAGVRAIMPILTKRTVKLGFNAERVRKIIKEAAEQAHRGILPELYEPAHFEVALARAREFGTPLFFDGSEDAHDVANVKTKGTSFLFIGPEGGWDDSERAIVRDLKIPTVSLGPTTLRAETAAIIASYLFTHD